MFRHAIQLDPSSSTAHANLAVMLAMNGQFPEAVKESAIAVSQHPRNPYLRRINGNVLATAGKLPEATDEFRKAVEMAPADQESQKLLRDALCTQGKLDEAAAAWREAINADPSNHTAWDGYAEFCLYIGHTDEYRWARKGLLDRFGRSSDPNVLERTARACLLTPDISDSDLRRATAAIDRVLAMLPADQPGPRPYFLFAKGLAEYRSGHQQAAIAIMEGPSAKVLGPAPKLVAAMAHFKLGQTAEAQKCLTAAVANFNWSPKAANSHEANSREAWIYHVLRREAEKLILNSVTR